MQKKNKGSRPAQTVQISGIAIQLLWALWFFPLSLSTTSTAGLLRQGLPRCSACNTEIVSDARFCRVCGRKFEAWQSEAGRLCQVPWVENIQKTSKHHIWCHDKISSFQLQQSNWVHFFGRFCWVPVFSQGLEQTFWAGLLEQESCRLITLTNSWVSNVAI